MDNHSESCNWLVLCLVNLRRAFILELDQDYPSCVFHLQQSVEFLTKALITLLGVEPRKSHDPGEQLKGILSKKMVHDALSDVLMLSSTLSLEYLNSRYPSDESPWETYNKGYVNETKEKVLDVLRNLTSIIRSIAPQKDINILECMRRVATDPKLRSIIDEMVRYVR